MQLCNLLLLSVTVQNVVLAWSPTNGYAPGNVTCDNDINIIRNASGTLSSNETNWLEKREVVVEEALQSFLKRAFTNFSDSSILDHLFKNSSSTSNLPKIAIAASGGGYRAMLSGAGMISAMDNRTRGANEHGLGGLLQSSTYLAGLSGGNWLTSTLSWNNWTSVQDILDGFDNDTAIWDLEHSLLTPGGINIVTTYERWNHISDAVESKSDSGFNTSLADIWGRSLSYYFWPSLYRGGVGYTWSTLREAEVFQNAEMPFPITLADGRYPGTTVINLNATNFEFNPFEMGSWDPTLNAFADVKYIGTNVSNGKPVNQGHCIAGFDNTGFITATSSTLFNQFLLQINSTSLPSFLTNFITHYLEELSRDSDDIAIYAPNPFKATEFVDSNYSTSIVDSDYLYLVDGGEDNQNIPLTPLIQKVRDVDVIFALDNSADTDQYWPDGASLVNTYQRQFVKQGSNLAFPYVPDVDTFVDLGLNTKPTFFGCDANNLTDLDYIPPLVVYIPNAEYSYASNQSTFKLSYSEKERISMIRNGFEAASMNNLTDDSSFLSCVGCAIIRRQQQGNNFTLPSECETCFTNYCWNGTISNKNISGLNNSDFASTAAASAVSSISASVSDVSVTGSTTSTRNKDSGANVLEINNSIVAELFSIFSIIFSLI
ncbi:hypothetical protein KAFR_0L00430 [Kazachstania africana CBS 2517]|uniref:Lysophospholipase n=1 Tax=Kazachstania africana (strain ATCC 22294 / BCRC 22015 / CBS 2517 / CECT 1963 / NBRC 1671 / NRRL Y-8276) TaxID=1071382 RepID=H2B200_KAZAF|nr:hypothetical protein KAFR_0L00430 [Kazachstania africana CBS 2517]CCF60650.1 hypothetical protein KAFR_0L00430 [Kazachstania africana CBS 2517]